MCLFVFCWRWCCLCGVLQVLPVWSGCKRCGLWRAVGSARGSSRRPHWGHPLPAGEHWSKPHPQRQVRPHLLKNSLSSGASRQLERGTNTTQGRNLLKLFFFKNRLSKMSLNKCGKAASAGRVFVSLKTSNKKEERRKKTCVYCTRTKNKCNFNLENAGNQNWLYFSLVLRK